MKIILRLAAPPPPTSTACAGSMPCFTVISMIACVIVSVASSRIAAAVASRFRPSGVAMLSSAAFAASILIAI